VKTLALATVLIALISGISSAQVILVPGQYPTIQKALNAAGTGTTILVAPGTYNENLVWPRTDGIRLIATGGSGVTSIRSAAPGATVHFPPGLTRATRLQGFHITRGGSGGSTGVIIASSPTVCFNRIQGHVSGGAGGGILAMGGGSPLIDRNVIEDNMCAGQTGLGGGILVTGGAHPMIRGNQIRFNRCHGSISNRGAGICIDVSAGQGVQVMSNAITRNRNSADRDDAGDGAALLGGTVDFFNNTVARNGTLPRRPRESGIYLGPVKAPGFRIYNNIVYGNIGYGILNEPGNPGPLLDFNNVRSNAHGGYHNVTPGLHDLSVDPQFAGNEDYHVMPTSPMVDGGGNFAVVCQSGLEIDSDSRMLDNSLSGIIARTDIGADEVGVARLNALGDVRIGSTVTFEVLGPPACWYQVFWSPSTANILIQPFGLLLINGFSFIGAGTPPGRSPIQVPLQASLVGVPLFVQGLVTRSAGANLAGAFTNRLDLTVLDGPKFIHENFTSTLFLDAANTTASWTGGPGNPGLFATYGYGGDGSDGSLIVSGNVTLDSSTRQPGPDGIVEWNYETVLVLPNGVLTLMGKYPIRLNVQKQCTVIGDIVVSGRHGLNAPAGPASQVGRIHGGAGGPGGGAGGDANTSPNSPIGALPMELRGGAGYPKATQCGEPNRSENRLVTVIEPNCGGGTGGNRGTPAGAVLRSGCSGNGGGHAMSGAQTDYLCSNIGAFGREFGVKWIVPTGSTAVQAPTAGTGGGAGGNAAPSTGIPSPSNDIVAGSGGGAGGGLEIVTFESLAVAGRILADGGNGGMGWSTLVGSATVSAGWGGGGAGGSVWLSGTSVAVNTGSRITAIGGIGNPNPPQPPRSGKGGDGYLVIRDRGGNPSVDPGAVSPAPIPGRSLFDPKGNGKSQATSLFYDSGTSSPAWAFDANDPQTGEVKPGMDLEFLTAPVANQKVFIAFQGAPDLNGKPNPNPATWFPAQGFEADISKLRVQGGLRHIRFQILFDLGKRIKGQSAQVQVTVKKLRIRY